MFVDLAHLFILHMFSKHSVPSHVISDKGSEFMLNFCTTMDIWLYFTSDYYPEGDGQTEYTNKTLEQYLCVYFNYQQDNWSELLSLAKFTYNNAPSTTIDISSFFANKRYHMNITIHSEYNIASL